MKSRITIEVDFENGNEPIIQILLVPSDDVRDNLLKKFIENLNHRSIWTTIVNDGVQKDYSRYVIRPIGVTQFKEQAKMILKQCEFLPGENINS